MIVVGSLRQRRQIGDLGDRELVNGLAEIVQRSRRDAVIAEAEIDLVEVELEDAVLRERRLDAQRQQRLANLALIGALVREQEVLGHLLGDRRGALLPLAAGAHIRHHGADDTFGVDTRMLVEILVLGGEKRLDDELGHGLDRHVKPPLAGIFGDQRSVGSVDAGHDRRLVIGELRMVGQVLREHPVPVGEAGSADQEENGPDTEQKAKKS